MPPQFTQLSGPPLTPPQKYLDPSHPVFQRHINVNANPMVQPEYQQEYRMKVSRETGQGGGESAAPLPPFELKKLEPKLEPVVTLQQLQSKRLKEMREKEQKNVEMPKLKEAGHEIPVTVETPGHHHNHHSHHQKPVYVVYPIKGQEESDVGGLPNGIVIASRGEQGVAPPVTSGAEPYQNTPFSVATHFEQEPILTVKDKPKKTSPFPYALERPENVPTNHRPDSIYNTGEQPQVRP